MKTAMDFYILRLRHKKKIKATPVLEALRRRVVYSFSIIPIYYPTHAEKQCCKAWTILNWENYAIYDTFLFSPVYRSYFISLAESRGTMCTEIEVRHEGEKDLYACCFASRR